MTGPRSAMRLQGFASARAFFRKARVSHEARPVHPALPRHHEPRRRPGPLWRIPDRQVPCPSGGDLRAGSGRSRRHPRLHEGDDPRPRLPPRRRSPSRPGLEGARSRQSRRDQTHDGHRGRRPSRPTGRAGEPREIHGLRRHGPRRQALSPRRRRLRPRMGRSRPRARGARLANLKRATQYAHFTPEFMIRAIWRALRGIGFDGGRVLEPGCGTGLFFALAPEALEGKLALTGVEMDAVTARIAKLLYPNARIRHEDFTKARLPEVFDLA